jgi:nickel/cobalt exporter
MNLSDFTIGGAALVALTHTLAGPDHYLPFIVMAKARKWSSWKTTWVTFVCGLGHVLSTVILGLLAYYIASHFLDFEEMRGDWAAWAFIIFGGAYMIYGIQRAITNKTHKHLHLHKDGNLHTHEHEHEEDHSHTHNKSITPWILFIIFFLGPCEAMLIYFPTSAANFGNQLFINLIIVFGAVTILSMLAIVHLSVAGLNLLPFKKVERYMHASAGFIIMFSGIAIKFLGL